MKMTLLFACLAASAYGQVAVYRTHTAVTMTGAGATTHEIQLGYTILDLSNGSANQIELLASNRFKIDPLDWRLVHIQGKAHEFTLLASCTNYVGTSGELNFSSVFVKGTDSHMIQLGSASMPRTLNLQGRSIFPDEHKHMIAEEASGVLVLDVRRSAASGELDNVLGKLRAELQSEGYMEIASSPLPSAPPGTTPLPPSLSALTLAAENGNVLTSESGAELLVDIGDPPAT